MRLIIELPPELETHLHQLAAQRGQDPATFAMALLSRTLHGTVDESNMVRFDAKEDPEKRFMEFAAA